MLQTTLKDLYMHTEWADATVWRSVLAAENGQGDKRLRELFYHLHLVQHAYLRAWTTDPVDLSFPEFEDARAVMAWGRSCYDGTHAYLQTLSDVELAKQAHLPWTEIVEKQIGGIPEAITLGEMMLQVPLHSLYHRGQINARLREVGGEPPPVDFVVWLWTGRPAADWDSVQLKFA